jgi:hypothetical protein
VHKFHMAISALGEPARDIQLGKEDRTREHAAIFGRNYPLTRIFLLLMYKIPSSPIPNKKMV